MNLEEAGLSAFSCHPNTMESVPWKNVISRLWNSTVILILN